MTGRKRVARVVKRLEMGAGFGMRAGFLLVLVWALLSCGGEQDREYCTEIGFFYTAEWPPDHIVLAQLSCESIWYFDVGATATEFALLGALAGCAESEGPAEVRDCVLTGWLDLGQDDGEACFGVGDRTACGPDPGDPVQVQEVVLRAGPLGLNEYHVYLEAP